MKDKISLHEIPDFLSSSFLSINMKGEVAPVLN
jgi:hypothetical protein